MPVWDRKRVSKLYEKVMVWKVMQAVKKFGGKLIDNPKDIPGVGKFIMIRDSEDNKIGMLQPFER